MLKRYQVLLNDWIEEYIKIVAEKYDLSFSAAIRINICLGILFTIPVINPEYEQTIDKKELLEYSKKAANGELKEEEIHQMMSLVLFEARKAVEYRLSQQKELKKN